MTGRTDVSDLTGLAALLLLADGRFPAGSHAHSAGVEAAVVDGRIASPDDLARFTLGRLHTAGLVEAALAAATVVYVDLDTGPGGPGPGRAIRLLDAEANARLGAAPLRKASRRLGRQLTRVAARCWAGPAVAAASAVHPDGPHQPVALGAVAVAAGIGPRQVALLSLHHALTTPLQAGLRLGGLDPFAVAGLAASLAGTLADLADEATERAYGPIDQLPCTVGPLTEIAAVEHTRRPSRLFAT